jgi:hypothetical protein
MKKVIALICIVTFPFACKNSDIEKGISPQIETEFTIKEAKDWYESTQNTARTNGQDEKKVVWQDAVQKKVDNKQSIVVVPFVSTGGYIGIKSNHDGRKVKSKDDSDHMNADVKRTYVFVKTEEKVEMMEMRIISDDSHLQKGKFQKLESDGFYGSAFLLDAEGQVIEGAFYENGKVIASTAKSERGRINYVVMICVDFVQIVTVNGEVVSGPAVLSTTCTTYDFGGGGGGSSLFSSSFAGGSGGGSGSLSAVMTLPNVLPFWNTLNDMEKDYFTRKAHLLPGAAAAYFEAEGLVYIFYCNNGDLGNWNAFKHGIWSALLSLNVGPMNALSITYNHEEGSGSAQVLQDMDDHNNQMGINLYTSLSSYLNTLPNYGAKVLALTGAVLGAVGSGTGQRILPVNAQHPSQMSLHPTTGGDRCN